jgi:flavin-dependent dehydrogenase
MSERRSYDAIIVGASFAGLAVARRAPGDVLLVDRHEVGSVQTSSCGTPLWVARALGVERSVLQIHDRLVFRTPARTVTYDLGDVPFCTFDYRAFTQGLLAQTRARFVRAAVVAIGDGSVVTTSGRFTAPVIVDASGWRGIAGRGSPGRRRAGYSFGLEAPTSLAGDGLTFILDRTIAPRGLAWVFPVGHGSLVGVGSYRGVSRLGPGLRALLRGLGAPAVPCHGTFFPHRLLQPTVGRVFAVGDAAGQCLPLTAEGIRPALYFGDACGQVVRRVVEGRLGLEAGLAQYARTVERYRRTYQALLRAQWLAASAPAAWVGLVAAALRAGPLRRWWWPRYGLFGRFAEAAA